MIVEKYQELSGKWIIRNTIDSTRSIFLTFDHDPTQGEVDIATILLLQAEVEIASEQKAISGIEEFLRECKEFLIKYLKNNPNATKQDLIKKVKEYFKMEFPVGSIYIATTNTNPNQLLGYGTWEIFGAGKTLIGIDTLDVDFNEAEKIGGVKKHLLSIDEIPSHSHIQKLPSVQVGDYASGTRDVSSGGKEVSPTSVNDVLSTQNAGGDLSHNNLQPYIVVYMWKRIS